MGTKADPGEYDCYAKADHDEPMFVLLARDPLAPAAVRGWAADARTNPSSRVDAAKVAEAQDCAHEMEIWRIRRDRRVLIDRAARGAYDVEDQPVPWEQLTMNERDPLRLRAEAALIAVGALTAADDEPF